MSEYTPTTDQIRAVFMGGAFNEIQGERRGESFDRWLIAHDAEVRAGVESDPAKDERLVRYMALVTPLGYQSALTVVQQMTLMIQAETEARRAGVVTEEPEWEYGWEADEEVRTTTRPRGPRILFDGVPYPPETLAAFARGRRIRRRKAGPWMPVES